MSLDNCLIPPDGGRKRGREREAGREGGMEREGAEFPTALIMGHTSVKPKLGIYSHRP